MSTETATDLSTKEGDNPSPNYSASEHHTERLKKEQSTKQQNSPEFVNIAIIDTGPGIAPEAQEKIFEWFYQGDHMRAGSGLGLHLSKRIAELHRGNLTLNSEVGKGSTFTLSLPRLT
ncbi:MAG: ATP-binding protein [Phormidesmis sp.]